MFKTNLVLMKESEVLTTWNIASIDNNAFLHGGLVEIIYMNAPGMLPQGNNSLQAKKITLWKLV